VWLGRPVTSICARVSNGLSLLVQEKLRDPHQGPLFVFCEQRDLLTKVMRHDGQGTCLYAKRLERGRFIWRSPVDRKGTITWGQLGYPIWKEPTGACRSRRGYRERPASSSQSARSPATLSLSRRRRPEGGRNRILVASCAVLRSRQPPSWLEVVPVV
jgi:IS66 Orf2 like protein